MRRIIAFLGMLFVTISLGFADKEPAPVALKVPAPEFRGIEAWLNSKPLDWKSLRGQVVVVHFWAFG